MSGNSSRDFSPRLLAVMEEPPAPFSRVVLLLLLSLLCLMVLWAFFGKLDIVARAQGKLIPQTRLQVVQPLDGGRVAEIRVAEGELVRKDQVLVLMDDEISRADTEQLASERTMVQMQLRRINAELENVPLEREQDDDPVLFKDVLEQYRENRNTYQHALVQQRAVVERTAQELDSEKQLLLKLEETLPIHKAGEQAIRDLQKNGFANRMALMERERVRIEVERDLEAQKYKARSLAAGFREASEKVKQIEASYRQQLLDEKLELKQRLEQLTQELNKQQYRGRLLTLKAPEDGYVKDLATHTQGSVIPSGTVLLTIVPVDVPLQAEVMVEDIDAGFVMAGQKAKVKVASYDFQRYGMIEAEVDHVSADSSQQPEDETDAGPPASGYRALLNLKEQVLDYNGEQHEVRTGMQVTAEINLGSRTVMEYIFSPVTRAVREAGRER